MTHQKDIIRKVVLNWLEALAADIADSDDLSNEFTDQYLQQNAQSIEDDLYDVVNDLKLKITETTIC